MVKQIAKFVAVCAIVIALWVLVKESLTSWIRPTELLVTDMLKERLKPETAEQRKLLRATVKQYPLESLFAAHQSGWSGIKALNDKGPDYTVLVPALAFKGSREKLDKVTALGFIQKTSSLFETFATLDPQYGEKLLQELRKLSVAEYKNMAHDPSYLMIVYQLHPRYRNEFRQNQPLLTPLLTLVNPLEWNHFMGRFVEAQPRIKEIIADPAFDDEYAWSFVLNRDLVKYLISQGFSERSAVHFLKLNSETAREAMKADAKWAEDLLRMQSLGANAAENGMTMTLFDWACFDPSIYWLVTQDESPQKLASFSIMTRYSGTELPNILRLHYSSEDKVLKASIDALLRFDNEQEKKPERRNVASKFLNHYQSDALFKKLLREHGALLIPALAAGGDKELAYIAKNPKNINKYVDEEGRPRSTWWHYIPGGSIVAVIRDLSAGRSVTAGEWGWAAFDAVTIAAITATSIKALSTAKGLKAAQPVGRALTAGAGVMKKGALPILAASGKIARKSVLALFSIVRKHPVKSLIGAMAVYYYMNPEALAKHSKQIGFMAATIPAAAIAGIWDQIADKIKENPVLSFFYYPILILFSLLVLALILAALKIFLKPVWDMLVMLQKPFRLLFRKAK